MTAIVEELTENWFVSSDQIFLTGHSQGGYFAQYLADQQPDMFTGYAIVAAGLPATLDSDNPDNDQPFIFFHDLGDPLYPYDGWGPGGQGGLNPRWIIGPA